MVGRRRLGWENNTQCNGAINARGILFGMLLIVKSANAHIMCRFFDVRVGGLADPKPQSRSQPVVHGSVGLPEGQDSRFMSHSWQEYDI